MQDKNKLSQNMDVILNTTHTHTRALF